MYGIHRWIWVLACAIACTLRHLGPCCKTESGMFLTCSSSIPASRFSRRPCSPLRRTSLTWRRTTRVTSMARALDTTSTGSVPASCDSSSSHRPDSQPRFNLLSQPRFTAQIHPPLTAQIHVHGEDLVWARGVASGGAAALWKRSLCVFDDAMEADLGFALRRLSGCRPPGTLPPRPPPPPPSPPATPRIYAAGLPTGGGPLSVFA